MKPPEEYDKFRVTEGKGKTALGDPCGTFIFKTTSTNIAGKKMMIKIHQNDDWYLLRIARYVSKKMPKKGKRKSYDQTFVLYPSIMEVAKAIRLFVGREQLGYEVRKYLTRMERLNKKWAEVYVPKKNQMPELPRPTLKYGLQ